MTMRSFFILCDLRGERNIVALISEISGALARAVLQDEAHLLVAQPVAFWLIFSVDQLN